MPGKVCCLDPGSIVGQEKILFVDLNLKNVRLLQYYYIGDLTTGHPNIGLLLGFRMVPEIDLY